MEIVKNGYKIPFLGVPPKFEKRNNMSAIEHSDFVTTAVLDLLAADLIEEVAGKPWIISPLSVASNSKLRLILDLSVTNKYVKSDKFCLEDQNLFYDLAKSGKYVSSFDLKACYHQIPIHKNSRQYLGFQWVIQGELRHFVFKVLPFGLTSGPYVCKMLFRPLVKKWREASIKVVLYFDDGILCAETFVLCNRHAHLVKSDLLLAHILPNHSKSVWEPQTSTTWLGYFWNFNNSSVAVSAERTVKLFQKLFAFRKARPFLSAKVIAKVVGSVVSMRLVFGERAIFLCRSLQMLVNFRNEHNIPWSKAIDFSEWVRTC